MPDGNKLVNKYNKKEIYTTNRKINNLNKSNKSNKVYKK